MARTPDAKAVAKGAAKGAVLARLRRESFDRGVLGGRQDWLVLGIALWGLKALAGALRRERGVLWQGPVEPGETLVVSLRPPPGKRGA